MILFWLGFLIILLFTQILIKEGFANNSLSLFANNDVSPLCTSTYSSDSGFICIDKNQENILLTRGGNRSLNDGDYHTGPLI